MLELRENYPYVRVTTLNKFMPPKDRIYPLVKAYTLGAKLYNVENQDKNTDIWCTEVREEKEVWLYKESLGRDSAIMQFITEKPIVQIDTAMDQMNVCIHAITFNDGSTAIYKQNKTSWDIYPLYGYNSPKVLLDHPLKKDTPNSDVICIACKDGKLYLSYQRYNFSEWIELASSTTASLVERIGFINKYTIGIMWR